MQPLPLSSLRDALRAPNPQARIVAQLHLAAHGADAADFAPIVAELLADPSEEVRWHVVQTMRAIAPGVRAAIAPLLPHLDGDDKAQARALASLAAIGTEASEVLDNLVDRPLGRGGLAALMAIGPDDPRVRSRIVKAVASEEYSVKSDAIHAVESAPASSLPKLLADIPLATVLPGLASAYPKLVKQRCMELLSVEPRGSVFLALQRLPQAYLADVVDKVAELSPPAKLLAVLPRDPRLTVVAREMELLDGASALAVHGDESDLPDLRDALEQGFKIENPEFYKLADVLLAIVALAPDPTREARLITTASNRAMGWWKAMDWQVRDFQRAVLRITDQLGPAGESLRTRRLRDTDLGEEEDEQPQAEAAPAPLPAMPTFAKGPPLRLRAGTAPEAATTLSADDIALRLDQRDGDSDELGALYGNALVQALGWHWATLVRGRDEWPAVVSEDEAYVLLPFAFANSILDKKREPTAMLTLNMLRAGRFPPRQNQPVLLS
jgi:hypothetical protein